MYSWQYTFLVFWFLFSFVGFVKGLNESKSKNNAYGNSHIFNLIGAFVWGDSVVFGLFWMLISVVCIYLNDWTLFLLIVSVFWLVRSAGETVYWFSQQFSTIERNPPKKLWFFKYFQNDSVWFVYQIFWQCILVISIVTTIYLADKWLA
jgi:hypothetical protein